MELMGRGVKKRIRRDPRHFNEQGGSSRQDRD
jgi:hypothetical protein